MKQSIQNNSRKCSINTVHFFKEINNMMLNNFSFACCQESARKLKQNELNLGSILVFRSNRKNSKNQ